MAVCFVDDNNIHSMAVCFVDDNIILNQLNKLYVQMKHTMYLWHFINLHLKIHFHCAINQLIRSQSKENHGLQQAY